MIDININELPQDIIDQYLNYTKQKKTIISTWNESYSILSTRTNPYLQILFKTEDYYYKIFHDMISEPKFKKVFNTFKHKPDLVYEGITKPTDFRNFLIVRGLESMGWYERVDQGLEYTQLSDRISDDHKSGIKRYLNNAYKNPVVAKEKTLTKELKRKTRAALIRAKVKYKKEPFEI